MKVLSLESSAKAASVAVSDGDIVIAQYFQASGLTHSRTLLAMSQDILKNLDLKMSDIDGIAIAVGPGSFTGIRIGLAAAKGLSWGSGKPLCGVSTLEAMAFLCPLENVTVCPVMDARRNQVYNARFKIAEGKITRITEDRAIALDDLAEEIKKAEGPHFILGDGALLCYNYIKDKGLEVMLAPEFNRLQNAWGVCKAASASGRFISPDDIVPNYLRLSQAERERLARLEGSK